MRSTSCDRAIFFRYMVHTLAQQHGTARDVHAEAVHDLTGNGCHFHMSLWRRRRTSSSTRTTRAGSGSPRRAYHFVGGLKAHARAYSAVTAPTVNSYKRLKLGSTTSGATWSPVWISYGYNNRTQMLRIPGPGRDRGPDDRRLVQPVSRGRGGARGGLDGIENGLDPGEPNTGEPLRRSRTTSCARAASRRCRRTSSSATDELERDDVIREALGRGRDEDYVDYFIRVKRDEWNRYHEQVTPWEIKEYLTRF